MQILAYAYIFAPVFIFFVFWSKPVWAIIGGVILLLSFFLCLKGSWEDIRFEFNSNLALLVTFIVIIVYFSGISGYTFQNSDLPYRNRIFSILVTEEWPVAKSVFLDGADQHRGLIYYIGFWLPAALFGKMTHSVGLAFLAMSAWTALGLFLTWYLLCRYLKKFRASTLIIFLFFGGLDLVGLIVTGQFDLIVSTVHIEWWTIFQFSSFMTQLFWVFNQALHSWIIILMILQEKKNSHLVFIWSFGMLSSTLPFAGMLPFLIYKIISNMEHFPRIGKKDIIELFSFENVLGGGFVGILTFFYLFGNDSAQVFRIEPIFHPEVLPKYIIFVVLEALIYVPFIYRRENRALLFVTIGTLLICPAIKVGYAGDFCMRVSIPALVVLFLFVMEAIQRLKQEGKKLKYLLLTALVIIGSWSAVHEVARSLVESCRHFYTVNMANSKEEYIIMSESNFSGKLENNIFYSYVADVEAD